MKLQIKITRAILQESMMCGTENSRHLVSENCAIACAVRDVFPDVRIDSVQILFPFGRVMSILLPQVAINFIHQFDRLINTPELRLELPELTFEVDVPDEIIAKINIEDIYRSETLDVVA